MTRRLPLLLALVVGLGALGAVTPRPVATLAQTAGTDTVIAAGDIAPATDQHNANDYATSEEVLRLLADAPEATVLALGDTQYERGALEAYTSPLGWAGSWGRLDDHLAPVAGNHEYQTPGAAGFFGYFADRLATVATSGDPSKGWYAFNLPNSGWRVYVLNSQCVAPAPSCAAGSPQVTWLQQDLAANPRRCVLAAWHHPQFATRAPFTDDTVQRPASNTRYLWYALNHVKADLVLSGHNHAYERFTALTPLNGTPSPTGEGIRQLIVGTGGRSLIPFSGTVRTGSRYRDAGHYGVLKLTLSPGRWDSQFVRTDGVIADSVGSGCWA